MINFFLYCIKKMSFSGSPKGTPHEKKLFCNENQWNWVVTFKKMMNMFTGDIYSMYVVLQGIGCLTLSYMYNGIYHIRNSVWGVATLDVWSSSTRTFQPKKRIPRNDQFLFILCLKNEFFRLTEGYLPPTTGVVELWKKNYFARKTNGIGWWSSKR